MPSKGSPLAVKLDRKLAGDEPLADVVNWWYHQYQEWRANNNITNTITNTSVIGHLSDNEILLHGLVRAWSLVSKSETLTEDNIEANADPDVHACWERVSQAREVLRAARKELDHIAQKLRRRLDRHEPIKDIRKWFMKQTPVWKSYFADLDPFLQWFVLDTTTDFTIFLEREESPDKPLTEIVLKHVAELRQNHPELAKPTIDRLMKLIDSAPDSAPDPRSWAKGAFTVFANDVECFSWTGTKQDAIDVQKYCLEHLGSGRLEETVGALGIPPDIYAAQAASYLIAYGVPAAGDADRRPSGLFDPQYQRWSAGEALCFRYAILRAALRERASDAGHDAGQRIEDVFAGKRFEIRFKGDQAKNRASMVRAQQQRGESSGNDNEGDSAGEDSSVRMRLTELDEPYLLDPREAVCMPYRDLLALAGRQIADPTSDPASGSVPEQTLPETAPETLPEVVYVPRIPIDAAEAEAMLRMTTTLAGGNAATDPAIPEARTYAGYTSAELSQHPSIRPADFPSIGNRHFEGAATEKGGIS
jgi:hypothetical protein